MSQDGGIATIGWPGWLRRFDCSVQQWVLSFKDLANLCRQQKSMKVSGGNHMGIPAISEAPRVDQFLMAAEARFDRWRRLLQEARAWDRSTNQQNPSKEGFRAALTGYFNELRQWEDYFAYPGQKLLCPRHVRRQIHPPLSRRASTRYRLRRAHDDGFPRLDLRYRQKPGACFRLYRYVRHR
jgi:hypothetical protein